MLPSRHHSAILRANRNKVLKTTIVLNDRSRMRNKSEHLFLIRDLSFKTIVVFNTLFLLALKIALWCREGSTDVAIDTLTVNINTEQDVVASAIALLVFAYECATNCFTKVIFPFFTKQYNDNPCLDKDLFCQFLKYYLAGEKLAGEKGTPGLLLGPVNLFKGPAFSGVNCLLFDAGTYCIIEGWEFLTCVTDNL